MATRKRGKGARTIVPRGLGRTERRGEAGFAAYCKCPNGFRLHDRETLARSPFLSGYCRNCGSLKPEWRCPVHKLKAVPLERDSAGCPRCGRSPKPQLHDLYKTPLAKTS